MKEAVSLIVTVLLATQVQAATWQFPLPASAKNTTVKVEVAPLKYGKTWAYSFEQDDSPATTLTVSQPLLAQYQWNDAPPGVSGGKNHPFVGTAAVIMGSLDAGNNTVLTYAQIDHLKKSGWGIANHSYAHSGNSWEPSQALKPDDFARELFWSQAVYADRIGAGRGAVHFVLPNGYVDYAPYLQKFGLRSNSRVGGSSPHNILDPKFNPMDLTRTYLDEGVWQKNSNPLLDFPEKPALGDFIIDFTHNIEADSNSANYKRWIERLNHIAKTWGASGDNSMWVAPTDDIVSYTLAARAAKITTKAGIVSVTLPDTVPGTALTLKMTGLSPQARLKTPPGATLYHQGNTTWLTTPIIGKQRLPQPNPRIRRIYNGALKNLIWDKPIALAGIRIRQFGPGTENFIFKLDTVTPQGKIESLNSSKLNPVWGGWNLYPILPNRPAALIKELRITPGKDLNEMEVWEVIPH